VPGLYIHIPFCRSKCVYCGFYSLVSTRSKGDFIAALKQEIALRQAYLANEPIRTLYFGGGTPSLLTPDELAEILATIHHHFHIEEEAEITLEANPEQLTAEYCSGLRALGINRLSIGVQSFQDPVLQFMGRRHSSAEALAAIRNAVSSGFSNISIDLIYGVSERNDEQWLEDLQTALSQPIRHLSCYALTPEENSILYQRIKQGKHAPVDDEQAARQYQQLIETIAKSGFQHYEISNFALPHFESRHNSSYWNHTPYLGLGPAAHSFNGKSRQWNPAHLQQYLRNIQDGITCEEREELSETDLYNETLLLGLRTSKGIDLQEIAARYGENQVSQLLQYFEQEVAKEHFCITESRLRLTEAGLWFADGIAGNAFM